MISTKVGTFLKKNTRTKHWWIKLGIAFILSNVFFFILFSGNSAPPPQRVPEGWVEVQLAANLLTPFEAGKKVLIVQKLKRKKIEALMFSPKSEGNELITVLVKEEEAAVLFELDNWEVLPFIKNLSFAVQRSGATHEIRY